MECIISGCRSGTGTPMWPSLDGSPGMVSTTELQNTWMWFIVRLLCFSPERFKQFFWMLGMQHIGRLGTPMMKSVNWHGPGLDLSPKCILHATSGSSFQWWNSWEDDSLGNGVKMLLGLWQRALGAWMAMHAFMAIEALSGFYVQPWWLVCVSFLVWLQLIT